MKLSKNLLVVALAAVCLSACQPHTNEATAPSSQAALPTTQVEFNPNQACTSDDNINTVKGIITSEAGKMAHGERARAMVDDPPVADSIHLDNIVVSKADPTLKKVECTAQLTIQVPDNLQKEVNNSAMISNAFAGNPQLGTMAPSPVDAELLRGGQRRLTFTVQPTADGKDTYVEVQNVDPPAHAIALVAQADANAS
jgi:hypothetical protein